MGVGLGRNAEIVPSVIAPGKSLLALVSGENLKARKEPQWLCVLARICAPVRLYADGCDMGRRADQAADLSSLVGPNHQLLIYLLLRERLA